MTEKNLGIPLKNASEIILTQIPECTGVYIMVLVNGRPVYAATRRNRTDALSEVWEKTMYEGINVADKEITKMFSIPFPKFPKKNNL